jgi:hypothetical protein
LPNQVCAFLASQGCGATGTCVWPTSGPQCLAYAPGCACDGSQINTACNGLPSGYETNPLLHSGPCFVDAGIAKDSEGGPPVGTSDASMPACPPGEPSPGVTCPSTTTGYCYYSGRRICSCDYPGGVPGLTNLWACGTVSADCPLPAVKQGDPCSVSAQRCNYDFRGCAVSPGGCVCSGGLASGLHWVCTATVCG